MARMSRFWIVVCVVIVAVLVACDYASSIYSQPGHYDPVPERWIGKTIIGTLLGLGGVAMWVFCFQKQLRNGQVSLAALLLLIPAAIVPVKIGLWLLPDRWHFDN